MNKPHESRNSEPNKQSPRNIFENFSCSWALENFSQSRGLRTDISQKTVVGCPWNANHSLFPSVYPNATINIEAKLAHNEGKRSLSRLVVLIKTSQTWPSILFFTAIAFVQLLTKQDCRDQRLQFKRAGGKMLCVVDYISNLLCTFNFLQPMKKFVFSIASRATGWLQIKPSGSGDENACNGCFLSPSFQDQVTRKWWTLGTEWDENDEWYEFNQMKRNHSKYQAITFGRVERNPVLTREGTVIPIQDE